MKGRTTVATAIVKGKKKAHVREGLLSVVTGSLEFSSRGNADTIRLTDEVREALRQSGLQDGTLTVFAPGATGAVTTIEYEPGVIKDLQEVLDAVVPPGHEWQHNINNGDGNGHSHVRAGLLGPSLTVPFVDGRLTLGRWQEIVFCDFDAIPRERSLIVQVMGV
ncbi:MAG: secondary thiamine-phosphate synthase enzyme YjbQ [Thermoleophilia bacterium]